MSARARVRRRTHHREAASFWASQYGANQHERGPAATWMDDHGDIWHTLPPNYRGERDARQQLLPVLAADRTLSRATGGRADAGLVDWDEDRAPRLAARAMMTDGGTGPHDAVTQARPDDGTILTVLAHGEASRRRPEQDG